MQLPEAERVVAWPELRRMAQLAEEIGFDSLWVGDHLLYREDDASTGPWESWSVLAALAAVTDEIEIGPLVAATSFHQPAMLAKKAATVQEIASGRLTLGLGAGWNQVEFDAFGFPFDHRVSRFEEAFTIIRTLLRDGRIDFAGDYYHLTDCELLPRPANPPRLMVGSLGPRMLSITLPYVEGWNAWFADYDNDPGQASEPLRRVDQACAAADRDPATLHKSLALLVAFDEAITRRGSINPIPGEPAAVTDALGRLQEAGVDHCQLILDPITESSMERLAPVLSGR